MAALRLVISLFFACFSITALAQDTAPVQLTGLKAEAAEAVDSMSKMSQEIVDTLFSFSELGFQEFETQAYLTNILLENDFEVELGVAGIPSSWWASC